LNLQAASAVVNFEPPWNPARLEQRIGRVHRLGQTQPVQVIHLLTEQSIEERVWETLQLKKALFKGLFDATADEVSFAKLGRKSMMQVMKEVFCDQPAPPKPVLAPEPPAAVPRAEAAPKQQAASSGAAVDSREESESTKPQPTTPEAEAIAPAAVVTPPRPAPDMGQAAAKLLEAGLNFLESIAPPCAEPAKASDRLQPLERALASLCRTDPQTQRPVLVIPLPGSFTADRLAGVVSGFLAKLAGSV
jgi:hypothetical protein